MGTDVNERRLEGEYPATEGIKTCGGYYKAYLEDEGENEGEGKIQGKGVEL